MRIPVARLLASALLPALLVGCVFPATEVLVVIFTDVDPAAPMTLSVRVARGGLDGSGLGNQATAQMIGPYTRYTFAADAGDAGDPRGRVPDGGVVFPVSFAVTPGTHLSHAAPVELLVEATVDGVVLRRRASFTFSPRQTTVVRLLVTGRCAARTNGCLTPGVTCTVQSLCEERGLTCGDQGDCVPIAIDPSRDRDASYGDIGPPTGCGDFDQVCCGGVGCRDPYTCVAGRCQRCTPGNEACCDGADLRPDDTACRSTTDPCKVAGVCRAGVCGPITDAPDGTVCDPPRNECERPGRCNRGACGQRSVVPDGTSWGSGGFNRCCGGQPVVVNTASNCNMCGLRCAPGQQCQYIAALGQHYCSCAGSNAQCAPRICRVGQPQYNDVCTCQSSADCPNGGTCVPVNFAPDYCRY